MKIKKGHTVDDIYYLYPRQRDTVIAALRWWQERMTFSRFYGPNSSLDDIASNCGEQESLDTNEIDILIEENLNK
jgi:hypothetical protein